MAVRDFQRSRVWKAESEIPHSPLAGLVACGAFVDRVVGSLWWTARFPEATLDRVPRLRPGHGARSAFYRDEGHETTITLPRRYRTKEVVLHELLHWGFGQAEIADHGPEFTRTMLEAVAEFCGPDRADTLTASYDAHRVKVAPDQAASTVFRALGRV